MSAADSTQEIVLWRHAEADDGMPDSERCLTARGVRQAERMADWLAARLPKHYRVLSSPATRAQQTARALQPEFVTDARIAVGARPGDLLAAVDWNAAKGTVVVVGHQPTLGRTAALLLCGTAQDWSVRKAGVWWISRREGEISLRAVMTASLI